MAFPRANLTAVELAPKSRRPAEPKKLPEPYLDVLFQNKTDPYEDSTARTFRLTKKLDGRLADLAAHHGVEVGDLIRIALRHLANELEANKGRT